jgi:hypothetical protein
MIVEAMIVVALPSLDCGVLSTLLYTNNNDRDHPCSELHRPVYLVRDDIEDIVATTWKHDEELGRGYLLLSSSFEQGKIWRWETGGGPIAIGRTLHLLDSGCRSNHYMLCQSSSSSSFSSSNNNDNNSIVGSGGIIVNHWHEPPRLVVAEWGEGRIARLEENGARTPLVIEYHDQDQEETP